MKAYTTIEQSMKLAEILPIETADMWYPDSENRNNIEFGFDATRQQMYIDYKDGLPCWSLAALLEQLPSVIKGHNLTICKDYWQIEKTFAYELSYEENFEDYSPSILVSASSIELIDVCVEMILKLKEKNLL